jgi:hypothetical protein
MNRIDLYNKTVDTLFHAYFNDTLRHGDCSACAVGNICLGSGAHLYGKYNCQIVGSNLAWSMAFYTETDSQVQTIEESSYHQNFNGCKDVIDATGYTLLELAKIEHGFETAYRGKSDDEHMFNGLVSVLEALKQIHEIKDERVTEVSRKRFADHYATK